MADAAKVLAELEAASKFLWVHHIGCAATADRAIALIESQAAEIERLTPKPMTLEATRDILNANAHRRSKTWSICYTAVGDGDSEARPGVPMFGSGRNEFLEAWEAKIIAQAYEVKRSSAKQEAARA